MNKFKDEKTLVVNDFEVKYMLELIRKFANNVTHMEQASGLSRRHIRALMIKHGLYHKVIEARIDRLKEELDG